MRFLQNVAPQLKAFVGQMRSLNLGMLGARQRDTFFLMVNNYESLLDRMLIYVGDQQPVFKRLLSRIASKDCSGYEELYNSIDLNTPRSLFQETLELHKQVKNVKQEFASRRTNKLRIFRNIAMSSLASVLTIGVVLLIAIKTSSTGAYEPIITILSNLLQDIGDLYRETHALSGIAKIEDRLSELEKHVQKLKSGTRKLGRGVGELKLSLELGDAILQQDIQNIYDSLCEVEKILMKP